MFRSAENPVGFLLSRLRWRSPLTVPVAMLVAAAGIATMLAGPQSESWAASPSLPSVTWERFVFHAGGHDSCQYVGTVHAAAGAETDSVIKAAGELGMGDQYEATSDGIAFRSDWYDCTNENAQPGEVPAGVAAAAPAGAMAAKVSLGQWIVGALVGAVVAGAIGVYGAPVIVAAAAAVGVTITTETAVVAAVCLAGATGGAIGEVIKGGTAPKIAVSTIVGCAGGAFIAKFMNTAQAEAVVGEAITSEIAQAAESATASAGSSVSSAAESIPTLVEEAQAVSQSAPHISSVVGQQLRRSASI